MDPVSDPSVVEPFSQCKCGLNTKDCGATPSNSKEMKEDQDRDVLCPRETYMNSSNCKSKHMAE